MGTWHLSSYNKLNLETLSRLLRKIDGMLNIKYDGLFWQNYESPKGIYFHISKYTNNCVYVQSLSCVWLSVAPWTVACQAPLSMRLSRQKYWSELPNFFLQRILLTQRSNTCLLHWNEDSLPLSHLGSPTILPSRIFYQHSWNCDYLSLPLGGVSAKNHKDHQLQSSAKGEDKFFSHGVWRIKFCFPCQKLTFADKTYICRWHQIQEESKQVLHPCYNKWFQDA